MADVNASANTDKYPHLHVYNQLLSAYNKPSKMPDITDLFENTEEVSYCDPFPHCVTGKKEIRTHLSKVSNALVDSFMLPMHLPEEEQFFIGNGGGFWAPSYTMSVIQTEEANQAWQAKWSTTSNKTCIVGSGQYMQWFFKPDSDKLLQIRVFYDAASRHTQSIKCMNNHLMLGDGKEDAKKRKALEGLFDKLLEKTAETPVVSPKNVNMWESLFTDKPEQQDDIELCAFYPFCYYGTEAKPSLWAWQDTDGETEKVFFTSGGSPTVSVSGNVGTAMTSFTNTMNGCLESHQQFMVFTLAEDSNKLQAVSILASHPAISMKYHNCHEKDTAAGTSQQTA